MKRASIRAFALGVITMLAAACGGAPGNDDGTDHGAATLTIAPAQSEHTILNGVQPTQVYTATATYADGTTEDVTDRTAFTVDGTIGAFDHNTLTMGAAGKGEVVATFADHLGQAQVIVHVQDVRVTGTLDPNTPMLFEAATEDAARAPNVLYPPANATMPRNLGDFEIHWNDASTSSVYEVSLHTELSDVRVYVAGGNGSGNGPKPSWAAFQATEWMHAVGTGTAVTYQVRGLDPANPTTVGSTAPRTVTLTNEALEGGIYYWAAAGAAGSPEGIWRHDMSKPGEPAEQFFTKAQTGDRCVACHVLSRDGTKMAITWDGGGQPAAMVDVATRTATPDTANWNFATFTPDAKKLLAVSNGVITVRDATTLVTTATMPVDVAGTMVSHPDLSPDGTRLVYTHDTPVADWAFVSGTLWTRSYDQATDTFGPETPLVTDGITNYYPSWSPDGQWVMFNRSDLNDNARDDSRSYNNANASLWVVKADGTGTPIELMAANATTGLTNSWGRWAPFVQTVGTNHEQIFWVTVSSQRDFGVRLVGTRTPQIWMTPFYVDRANAGQDPSAPAFRLPFQNILTNNHIAQWTEQVIVLQ